MPRSVFLNLHTFMSHRNTSKLLIAQLILNIPNLSKYQPFKEKVFLKISKFEIILLFCRSLGKNFFFRAFRGNYIILRSLWSTIVDISENINISTKTTFHEIIWKKLFFVPIAVNINISGARFGVHVEKIVFCA